MDSNWLALFVCTYNVCAQNKTKKSQQCVLFCSVSECNLIELCLGGGWEKGPAERFNHAVFELSKWH